MAHPDSLAALRMPFSARVFLLLQFAISLFHIRKTCAITTPVICVNMLEGSGIDSRKALANVI
jgi:hypothetical protein